MQSIAVEFVSFNEMIPSVIYKNINCWDDQLYMREGKNLLTSSAFSGGIWSTSTAGKTDKNFVKYYEIELNKRLKVGGKENVRD